VIEHFDLNGVGGKNQSTGKDLVLLGWANISIRVIVSEDKI